MKRLFCLLTLLVALSGLTLTLAWGGDEDPKASDEIEAPFDPAPRSPLPDRSDELRRIIHQGAARP